LRFLTKQRQVWLKESQKYEEFQFVIGFQLRTRSNKYFKAETHWCGHENILNAFTKDKVFGNDVAGDEDTLDDRPIIGAVVPEPYNPPPEDFNIPGVEEWICADMSPVATTSYEWSVKVRTFIKFAWFQEYKGTQHGIVKQPYSYVKKHPELLFTWWNTQFPEIPFDTVEIGKQKNAKRIVEYIHKRYVVKDPTTLISGTSGGGTTAPYVDESLVGGGGGVPQEHVSQHDIQLLYSLLPSCDPIHLLEGQPVVLDMAQYQISHACSREETYQVFGYAVSDMWTSWARHGGESTWAMIAEKQVKAHQMLAATEAMVMATRPKVTRRSRTSPVLSVQVPIAKRSARVRTPSRMLEHTVTDSVTRNTIRRNTRNVASTCG